MLQNAPEVYRQLLEAMLADSRRVKEFINVLILRRDHHLPEKVDRAVAVALERRCPSYDAIAQLCRTNEPDTPVPPAQVPDGFRDTRVDRSQFQPQKYGQLVEVGA